MTNNGEKVRAREYVAYGAGGIGVNMLFCVLGAYLLIYMTNVALLDAAVISAIIAVSKLFDGISDLIIGDIVDRTISKLGKARIWMLRICIPFAVSMLLLFMVPPQIPQLAKYIYVFLMYNLASTVCYTFMNIPLLSMVSLISTDKKENSIAGNIAAASLMAGSLIGNSLFVKLLMQFTDEVGNQNTQKAYSSTIALYGLIMVVLVIIMIFSIKERAGGTDEATKKSRDFKELLRTFGIMMRDKNWIALIFYQLIQSVTTALFLTGASYFALYVIRDMGAMSWLIPANLVPSITVMWITPFFIGRINKKKMLTAGLAVCAVASALLGFFGHTKPAIAVLLMLCSTGGGMHSSVFYGMVADAVSDTAHKTGNMIAGTGNAVISAVKKIGASLASVVFGFALSAVGFNAALDAQGIAQPDSVLSMIRALYIWVPCVSFVITLIVFSLLYNNDNEAGAGNDDQDIA